MINTGLIDDAEILKFLVNESSKSMCLRLSPDSFTTFMEYDEPSDTFFLVVMSETGDTEDMRKFSVEFLNRCYAELSSKIKNNLNYNTPILICSESRQCKTRL